MIVQQTSIFKRRVKRMHKAEKLALDEALKVIMSDPSVGDLKVGDLSGIQVFKYKHKAQLYLIAYEYIDDKSMLTFIES